MKKCYRSQQQIIFSNFKKYTTPTLWHGGRAAVALNYTLWGYDLFSAQHSLVFEESSLINVSSKMDEAFSVQVTWWWLPWFHENPFRSTPWLTQKWGKIAQEIDFGMCCASSHFSLSIIWNLWSGEVAHYWPEASHLFRNTSKYNIGTCVFCGYIIFFRGTFLRPCLVFHFGFFFNILLIQSHATSIHGNHFLKQMQGFDPLCSDIG